VILRDLAGLSAGRIDIAEALIADGARPAVLVTFDQQTFFEIDEMSLARAA
jgi:hypothetical protein